MPRITWFCYFYPRPPRGGRRIAEVVCFREVKFLSTPSARRATHDHRTKSENSTYFYPRPPRGGRLRGQQPELCVHQISIHALREEGDPPSLFNYNHPPIFLSTPSARRATTCTWWKPTTMTQFLSTPSARRATAKTETKSLFSYKLYNILHEFRRALIYNGSKNYPNHAK